MDADRRQARRDWAVTAALLGLCAVLLALQYRWTGALARAELASLQSSLRMRTAQVGLAFDEELRRLCATLVPTVGELDALGMHTAHAERLSRWLLTETRRPFRRVAVVGPDGRDLVLHDMDHKDGTLRRAEWPEAWTPLRDQFEGRWRGEGGRPSVPAHSLLLELPVMAEGGEREWMVFEIDETYLRTTWLPELLAAAFPIEGDGRMVRVDVRSRTAAAHQEGSVLRWPTADAPPPRTADASVDLFPRTVTGSPNRRDRPPGQSRWTMDVWYGSGPLDATVAAARNRNLGVAAILIGLIAATAWARTQVAARARRLAARELAFVAGVSHDLRTPLAAIRGAGHNLRSNLVVDAAKQRTYGDLIVERADQLTMMVEQLLSLASVRRSAHAGMPRRLPIGPVVEAAVRATAEAAAHARCVVDLHMAPSLPAVLGESAELQRAFENLLVNAVTHGASGGWVGVRAVAGTGSDAPTVEVSVADRGPGVPAHERARIWKPFERGATGHTAARGGFGLGLSLVREAVERHGGTVSLESAEGAGATFIVRLPATSEDV
jgi:two-component system phosphate regulon sensor histidine kinase PhoR